MKKIAVIFTLAAALVLPACTNENATDEETSVDTTTALSEVETDVTTATEPPVTESDNGFTVLVAENEEEYVIYWQENGEEKSEVCVGFKSPYTIINTVYKKYFGEEINMPFYDADWYITEYYEDVECEDGLSRNVFYTGVLDMSEGYSASLAEDLDAVTDSIAKSFIGSYDLQSIRITEMKEDILYMER